jgi:hypothetical protein
VVTYKYIYTLYLEWKSSSPNLKLPQKYEISGYPGSNYEDDSLIEVDCKVLVNFCDTTWHKILDKGSPNFSTYRSCVTSFYKLQAREFTY